MQASGRYNNVAIALHWIVAILVLIMIGLGIYMIDVPRGSPERTFYFNLHKSIGLTTGLIVLFRFWWRKKNPPPPLPSSMAPWEVTLSKISHALLYTCLIMMPIAGFIASQFTKYGVTYFGLFKIPPMGSPHKVLWDFFQGVHENTAYVLMALIVLHVFAALFHLIVKKDGVFQRMFPGR